jgi:hypothetical protein
MMDIQEISPAEAEFRQPIVCIRYPCCFRLPGLPYRICFPPGR